MLLNIIENISKVVWEMERTNELSFPGEEKLNPQVYTWTFHSLILDEKLFMSFIRGTTTGFEQLYANN